jgi:ribosome maturation factor RimP
VVAPLLADRGLELFDVEYRGGVLRVSIDRPGGIDLDAIAQATHDVSELLDAEDLVPGERYTLEVSSPGVERPLRTPEHFRRYLGTTVAIKATAEVEGERRIQGRLDAVDDDTVTVDGRTLAYCQIERARTVFEWGPAPKPTTKKKKATTP